ncbi:MAG: Glycerate kinase [Lentisphaerae bacterium ADurb.Bin242]|nr:MAG: Glycerate kinase [Lentisphaerae bacterium ADurb.Bin242]
MKIILAPDKFKGNMTSPEVCALLQDAFLSVMPSAQMISLPMADGGEGTVEAVVTAHRGELRFVEVSGPLGDKVKAGFGLYHQGRSAVLEMSSASGLALLDPARLDPLAATTYGTGELIRAALDCGIHELTIGIGGSATVDGGAGMAQALGYRLLDKDGQELPRGAKYLKDLSKIDASGADRRLFETRIRVACDVTNPLLGPDGAAAVYGPQKGARTREMIDELEKGLTNLADLWLLNSFLESVDRPGDGAAGGLGAGLRAFCKATPTSGARLVMSMLELEKHLAGANLLITGEGCTDSQTESGKLCAEIAAVCKQHKVPVLLLSGALKGDPDDFNRTFDFAFSTSTGAHASLADAVRAGKTDLRFTAVNLAKLIARGGLAS